MPTLLYIVVPCYNEEEVLPETATRLRDKLASLAQRDAISDKSRVLFVDDGSKDRTWEIIRSLHESDARFCGLKCSRNRGHQNALMAGLTTAAKYADAIVSMDADLQDDVNAVDAMLEEYAKGFDVVYGVRSARDKDSAFKRATARGFYRLLRKMGAEVVFDHADYRLMSRRAAEGLLQFKETNLFLRGIVPMVGFPSSTVKYERGERFAGKSKYPLKKMLAFAADGITGLSVKPLHLVLTVALLLCALGFSATVATAVLFGLKIVGSWALLLSAMGLFTGLILLALGIVGEYVGKTYMESKHRPPFLVQEYIGDEETHE